MQHPREVCPAGIDCYDRTIGRCVSKIHTGIINGTKTTICRYGVKCRVFNKQFICGYNCLTPEEKAKCWYRHVNEPEPQPCKWTHPDIDKETVEIILLGASGPREQPNVECPKGPGCPLRHFGWCPMMLHPLADRKSESLCYWGIRCWTYESHPDLHLPPEHEHFDRKKHSNRQKKANSKASAKSEVHPSKSDSKGSNSNPPTSSTPSTMSVNLKIVSSIERRNDDELISCNIPNCSSCAGGVQCGQRDLIAANDMTSGFWTTPGSTITRTQEMYDGMTADEKKKVSLVTAPLGYTPNPQAPYSTSLPVTNVPAAASTIGTIHRPRFTGVTVSTPPSVNAAAVTLELCKSICGHTTDVPDDQFVTYLRSVMADIKQSNTKVSQLITNYGKLELQVKKLTEENKTKDADIVTLTNVNNDFHNENVKLYNDMTALETNCASLKAEKDRLNKLLATEQLNAAGLSNKVTKLEAEIAALKAASAPAATTATVTAPPVSTPPKAISIAPSATTPVAATPPVATTPTATTPTAVTPSVTTPTVTTPAVSTSTVPSSTGPTSPVSIPDYMISP